MMSKLPEQFSQLEAWASWAFATEEARYARRTGSSMEQLREFRDALAPHMPAVIEYLSAFPWGERLSEQDEKLYHLSLSFIESSIPLDFGWKQPVAANSYECERFTLPADR